MVFDKRYSVADPEASGLEAPKMLYMFRFSDQTFFQ
jgi:hypothetical protein